MHRRVSLTPVDYEALNARLRKAAEQGAADELGILIFRGADIHTHNGSHKTPLHYAAEHGSLRMAMLLIGNGAFVNSGAHHGNMTPLMGAAHHDRYRVSKYLLARGARKNLKTTEGMTALIFAAREGSRKVAELLVVEGANIHVRDLTGRAAIDYAIKHSNDKWIADLLREAGATE
jgi:ankyrin repeat protein